MNNKSWNDYNDFDDDDVSPQITKKVKTKERKRKWREIETIKEKQRLYRELSEFNNSNLESDFIAVFG